MNEISINNKKKKRRNTDYLKHSEQAAKDKFCLLKRG